MLNKLSVPVISDWGIAGEGEQEDCDKYFKRNRNEWKLLSSKI